MSCASNTTCLPVGQKTQAYPLVRISGDRCLLATYGYTVDAAVNEKVRRIALLLYQEHNQGIEEVVPSYSTLAIFYDPDQVSVQELTLLLDQCEQKLTKIQSDEARIITIPVCYGGSFGPDMEDVARHSRLDTSEVIHRHSSPIYRIYAIGFAPGFCYLGGLDKGLHIPRLKTPRTFVAAGSVGIAGSQTGIYPQNSPGGWRIIGRTPLTLFDASRAEPCLYRAGDSIRFLPVDRATFQAMLHGQGE